MTAARRSPMRATLMLALAGALALAATTRALAGGGIKPGSAKDKWMSATSEDNGKPIIHSLRVAAYELANRDRFRWRIGITWSFHYPLINGMPGPADRAPMTAIDDAIHDIFERKDAHRIVYFTTGGGMREVMLYGTSEAGAWAAVDALFQRFPDWFPGERARWAYVKADPGWDGYRGIVQALGAPRP